MNDYTMLGDSELVLRARDNEKAAFGELYNRYITRIYNYVYYRTGNKQDAEDLTARVFMRALKHIATYDERGVPFSAWLYRIAHNLVANWHRDRSRRKVIPLDEFIVSGARSDLPEELAVRNEEQERLLQSIHRLPEDRQQLLILKYVDSLSNAEIGAIMDRTEGAIKSLYHRTLAFLREDMTGDMQHDELIPRQQGVIKRIDMPVNSNTNSNLQNILAEYISLFKGDENPEIILEKYRGSASSELDILLRLATDLTEVLVPVEPSPEFIASLRDELLGETGQGLAHWLKKLNSMQLAAGIGGLTVAAGVYWWARKFSHSRKTVATAAAFAS